MGGFEVSGRVQTGEVTLDQLLQKLGKTKEKDRRKYEPIFNMFNTNKTANADGQQVLDASEQAAMMAYLNSLKGNDGDDATVSKKDIKGVKVTNDKGKEKNLSHKDLGNFVTGFDGVVAENGTEDDITITGTTVNADAGTRTVAGKGEDGSSVNVTLAGTEGVGRAQQTVVTSEDGNTTATVNYEGETPATTIVKKGEDTQTTTVYATTDMAVLDQSGAVAGKSIKQETVEVGGENPSTTVTDYYPNGGGRLKVTKTEGSDDDKTTTTTEFNPAGGKKTEVVEHGTSRAETNYTERTRTTTDTSTPSVTTIENFTGDEPLPANITKTTVLDADKKEVKVSEGNTTTVYNGSTLGDITDGNRVTKTVVNDDTKTVSETNYADKRTVVTTEGKVTKIELFDNDENSPTRTATFDRTASRATYQQGGNSVSLDIEGDNVLTYARFDASTGHQETVAEAAKRLGFQEGTEAYNQFIAANGGNAKAKLKAGQKVKIPQMLTMTNGVGFSAEGANVDAAQQRRNLNTYQTNQRIAHPERYVDDAVRRHTGSKIRKTWASGSHQVYVDEAYANSKQVYAAGAGVGDYQQHWGYDPRQNKMVKLEELIKGIPQGYHVDRITEDGKAHLVNAQGQEKTIAINFKTFSQTEVSTSEYNTSFTESATKGAKGEIEGTVDPEKHKYVYQGNQRTNVLTNEVEHRGVQGNYYQPGKAMSSYQDAQGNTVSIYPGENGNAGMIKKCDAAGNVLSIATIQTNPLGADGTSYIKLNNGAVTFNLGDVTAHQTTDGTINFTRYTEYNADGTVKYDETASRALYHAARGHGDQLYSVASNVTLDNLNDYLSYASQNITDDNSFEHGHYSPKRMKVTIAALSSAYPEVKTDANYEKVYSYCFTSSYTVSKNDADAAFKALIDQYNLTVIDR